MTYSAIVDGETFRDRILSLIPNALAAKSVSDAEQRREAERLKAAQADLKRENDATSSASKKVLDEIAASITDGIELLQAQFEAARLEVVCGDVVLESVEREYKGFPKQKVLEKGTGKKDFIVRRTDVNRGGDNEFDSIVLRVYEDGRVEYKPLESSKMRGFERLQDVHLANKDTRYESSARALGKIVDELVHKGFLRSSAPQPA